MPCSKLWPSLIGILIFALGMGDTTLTYFVIEMIPDVVEVNPLLNYLAAMFGNAVAFLYFPAAIFITAGLLFYKHWYASWKGMRFLKIAIYTFLAIKVCAIAGNLWQLYSALDA